MTVITIVTLNINGLQTTTREEMLTSFLRRHEVDILFAQEVTNTEALQIPGYTSYHNIGATMRDTSFLAREGIQLDHIAASPTGRVMAATFQCVLLLNVHAPSGTTMRA
jgi:exonuclease III